MILFEFSKFQGRIYKTNQRLANRHAPDLLKFTAVILICWQGDRR